MSVQHKPMSRMTVDEFLVWAENQPGRYELLDGDVLEMSPQRARHADAKFAVQTALHTAIRRHGLPCRMMPDGMTVRIDQAIVFGPDALVYCGPRTSPDAVEIPNPVIVVEIISLSTKAIDTGAKFAGYFSVASVMHYLIVDPSKRVVIHHRRGAEMIETRIVSDGALRLDPPGLNVSLAEIFAEARTASLDPFRCRCESAGNFG